MQAYEEKIKIYPLFIGLTKPTMYLGVTLTYFALNGFINLILFIATSSWLTLLLLFPLMHLIGYFCCLVDPRIFDLLIGRLQCANCRNNHFWGCNSYEPY